MLITPSLVQKNGIDISLEALAFQLWMILPMRGCASVVDGLLAWKI
jgi:hypothetical protein